MALIENFQFFYTAERGRGEQMADQQVPRTNMNLSRTLNENTSFNVENPKPFTI